MSKARLKDRFATAWPADKVMLMAVGHPAGDVFTVGAVGELALTVTSERKLLPAPPESLDVLEKLRWVKVNADGTTALTRRGRAASVRWLEERIPKSVLRKFMALKVTGVRVG